MKKLVACIIISCCLFTVMGQNRLRGIITAIDSLHKRQSAEKLYLQLDKPYYAIGDTMRFKAYLMYEALLPSTQSGLFYVELINDSSRVVKRQTIMLRKGMAWGDIVIRKTWYQGNYTLRAYTNWMRNLGEEQFFTRQITIIPADNKYWLVNERLTVDPGKNVNLSLKFSDLLHRNMGFRDMQLSVLQKENILLKNKTSTGALGELDFKFSLPEKLTDGPLSVLAEDISKGGGQRTIVIPIQLNRPENIDLQFMPEGGKMVAGIKTKIGFKAINEAGMGAAITGKIVNNKQQQVAVFQSTHKGMGRFELTPQAGDSYTAMVALPNDSVKNYPLPAVNASGIALKVNAGQNDSLEVALTASPDLLNKPGAYYLIAEERDKVCYAENIFFNSATIYKKIANTVFATGAVKFVLFDADNRPVAQRMAFVDHEDLLNINLATNKQTYATRDSVGLLLTITNAVGKPVQGNFSLAVTDDSQVKPFDSDAENIVSRVLLNHDIKGNIEDPGYYFNKEHADRSAARDNLLLTQGWIDYDWRPAFEPPKNPEYEAETEFKVRGRASDVLGLPVNNTEITLTSIGPKISMTTQTGKGGRFVFSGFPRLDTIGFLIKPVRTFNIGLKIDEFVPPEFTPIKNPPMPWYINSDSTIISYVNKKQAEADESIDRGKSKMLKEVKIDDKKIEPTIMVLKMDEEAVRNARPGRKTINLYDLIIFTYKIHLEPGFGLLVDGKPQHEVLHNDYWLEQNNTEDIKGLSVVSKKGRHTVLVTTNTGTGEVISGTKGYAYRPMPISWPHRFYSPRYTVKSPAAVKDTRSTIYWEPDIETHASGKIKGFFFTADQPGTYTMIVEGTDMNGNFGYTRQQIKIIKK